ncbi:DUF1439 domain-containing protein [Simplicispira metamorpha]|uniref:DUF1439 domain-containing protein n=1 Tax=Simplicispira metamorpha TaxID=80881 RepID=A0A4R2N6S4_9BURK|nr:DUF1439 domain-containing protein [Simplicispira metamorpha]TCP16613.1 hypothetical protein EV674_11779 [Simplicispira metamorpha]
MQRRFLLIAGAAAVAGALGACASAPSHTVLPLAQLQQALAQRFPRTHTLGGALVQLQWQAPQLQALPERNRLRAQLAVQVSGPLLRRSVDGTLALDFALRYEASDATLRATDVRLGTLDFPGLPPATAALVNTAAGPLAAQWLGEVVLYTLRPQDQARLAARGLQPGAITVTAQGLEVQWLRPGTP